MKTFLSLVLLLSLTVSCASPSKNIAALVKELAKDPATAYVRIPMPHGTLVFIRTNPGTNTVPHAINPEGLVTIGK